MSKVTVIAKGSAVGQKLGNPVQFNDDNANLADEGAIQTLKPKCAAETAAEYFPSQKKSAERDQCNKRNQSINIATVPIRDVTQYNNWRTIKARVISKSEVHTWSNYRGTGKLFSVDLMDESGEVRMVGFDEAVEKFYDKFEVNHAYIITKFNLKEANKKFSSLRNEYEFCVNAETQVRPCLGSYAEDIPSVSFAFTEIGSIGECEKDKIIDVIGVCKRRGELEMITTRKEGKELKKKRHISR